MQPVTKSEALRIGIALKHAFSVVNLKSQKSIENLTGVDQTQVSRILRGDFRELSQNVERLCKYANVDPLDPNNCPSADAAVKDGRDHVLKIFEFVWDGSPEHAAAIGNLILATRPLSRQAIKRSTKTN